MNYVNKQFGCYRYYQSKIKYLGLPNHYKVDSLYLTLDNDAVSPIYLIHNKQNQDSPESFEFIKDYPYLLFGPINLSTYFKDPLDPTDEENALFEVGMGYPNPLIKYLVKYTEEGL